MTQQKAINHIRWYSRKVREAKPSVDPRIRRRRKRLIKYKKELNRRLEDQRLTVKA